MKNRSRFLKMDIPGLKFKQYEISFTRSLYFRLGIVLMLNLLYYSFSWNNAVNLLGKILEYLFNNWADLETRFINLGFTGLLKYKTRIDRSCTYIELYMYILPFVWNTRKSWLKNIFIMMALIFSIQIINILRIYCGAIWRINTEAPRWLYHDLPDTLIWYGLCFSLCIYGSLKSEPVGMKLMKIAK